MVRSISSEVGLSRLDLKFKAGEDQSCDFRGLGMGSGSSLLVLAFLKDFGLAVVVEGFFGASSREFRKAQYRLWGSQLQTALRESGIEAFLRLLRQLRPRVGDVGP